MDFSLPTWFIPASGWVVGIISAGFAILQAYANGFSATEKQKDKAAIELVEILQKTVDTLKQEMKDVQANYLENVKELGRLKGENETLMKILQGRDESYLKFQQDGLVAFKRIETVANDMGLLVKSLDKHFSNIKQQGRRGRSR